MKNTLSLFTHIILFISTIILLLSLFFPLYFDFLKIFVFASTLTLSFTLFTQKRFYSFITFLATAIWFNPIQVLIYNPTVEKIITCLSLLYFCYHGLNELIDNKRKTLISMAYFLDNYLHELDEDLRRLSYHQIILYIIKQNPDEYQLNDATLIWKIERLPLFEFILRLDYFLNIQQPKGGISAQGSNQFKHLLVHLNFRFSHPFRYSVLKAQTWQTLSWQGKWLKSILIKKYHYLDYEKILGP